MKEIGGYLELECRCGEIYHQTAYRLNSGRSALKSVIKSGKIRRVHIPTFTCPVVWESIREEGAECLFYNVNEKFLPDINFPFDDYIIYTNYFGCCARQVRDLASEYPNLIVDNAQAFYMPDVGFASIYSPRKFFGIPDGGLLYCRQPVELPTKVSVSWNRCHHLLKRHDLGASAGYDDFKRNSGNLRDEGVALMSNLTEAMMKSIDYAGCAEKRKENFKFLHSELGKYNQLDLSITSEDIPLIYPFLTQKQGLRGHLIENKIYVAIYWPGVESAYPFFQIIPLPIDHRYGVTEMSYIADIVKRYV
ncbi:MAG: hypothetical protein MR051_05115 [Lentisphaeria bacterium]|nr:hypothetical protein [Lentisphaeria bacterium]